MTSPTVTVFSMIKTTLDQFVADGGMGETPPLIRFERFRPTTKEERAVNGCIAIGFRGSVPEQEESLSIGELVGELTFVLILDYDIPPSEDDPEPTGIANFEPFLPLAMKALKADDSPMKQVSDWVINRGLEADENAGDDVARLIQTGVVQYRISTVDPTYLYAQGDG